MSTYLPDGMPIPGPSPDGLDGAFYEGLAEHRLVVPHCDKCGTYQWPPEVLCWKCHNFDVGWQQVEPVGRLFSWTKIWHPVRPQLAQRVPYIVALVELPGAGDIRLIGNLLGDPHRKLSPGMPVRGVFEDHTGETPYTLLQWEAVD